ncbi:hypothetical protein CYY_008324 [Polysphondylium violaceum]|uniref:G-protein coupled receptors family 3 profile domain-containing protein n=1 Tax=Polysphondylium violaceum TaxID=133409 RepID=A0A8J4PN46_9MYCE|nr:hypothetical protein CYY_008324 [Polysphondylium violaceum]
MNTLNLDKDPQQQQKQEKQKRIYRFTFSSIWIMKYNILVLLIIFYSFGFILSDDVFYLKPKGSGSTGDCGYRADNPCDDLTTLLPRIRVNFNTTVILESGIYTGNFDYQLTNYTLTIIGKGPTNTIIDLERKQRFMTITITTLNIYGVSFINGFTNESLDGGAAISSVYSFVCLENVHFRDCSSEAPGGALNIYNSEANMTNCRFINNRSNSGGAIIFYLTNSRVYDCVFKENSAKQEGKGGAMEIFISTIDIINSVFAYNLSPYSGAIDMVGGNLTVRSSIFVKNQSNIGGAFGSYFISQSSFVSCIFEKNSANNTGGFGFLTAQSLSIFSLCKFIDNFAPNSAILETHSISPVLFESCTFRGNVETTVQISLFDNYCFMKAQDCYFHNLSGVLIYADSVSNILIEGSKFTDIQNRVIDVGNQADILLISSVFKDIEISDYLIALSNGKIITYDVLFDNITSLAIIRSTLGGTIDIVNTTMSYNNVTYGLIYIEYKYTLYIERSFFLYNSGSFRGCIVAADHTGSEIIFKSVFIGNQSPYGPIIFFSTPTIARITEEPSMFTDITFIDNYASIAGALVYFSDNISIPDISCTNCTYTNNTARYGELVNSSFYKFNVSMPTILYPHQEIVILVNALDYFDNLIRGSSDLGFFAIACSDSYVEGSLFSVLNENGTATFNVRISSFPGTTCNLTILSVPTPSKLGPTVILITFIDCNSDRELVEVNSIFYCLCTVDTPTFVKFVLGVIALILALMLIASGVISLKYRKKRVIRYSNPLFLIIILIGCLVYLVLIPVMYSTSSASCKIRFPIIIFALSMVSSSVFVKQFRIWKLIKDIQLLRETNVENKYLLQFVSLLMIVPVLIIIVSFFALPTKETVKYDTEKVTITHYCTFDYYFIYIIIFLIYQMGILFFGCYLVIVCRKFRSVPGTFNEATYIGILIYNYTVVIIVAVPLSFVFHQNPLANFLILSISCLVFVFSTIALLFIPKFHFLIRNKVIISSLEKLIKEQEVIVQRNKDILSFYELYLSEERPNGLENPSTPYQLRNRRPNQQSNLATFSSEDSSIATNSSSSPYTLSSSIDSGDDDDSPDFNQHLYPITNTIISKRRAKEGGGGGSGSGGGSKSKRHKKKKDINNNNYNSNTGTTTRKRSKGIIAATTTSSRSLPSSPNPINRDENTSSPTNTNTSKPPQDAVGKLKSKSISFLSLPNSPHMNRNQDTPSSSSSSASPSSLYMSPPAVSSSSPSQLTSPTTSTSTISSDNSPDLNAEINPYLKPNSMKNITRSTTNQQQQQQQQQQPKPKSKTKHISDKNQRKPSTTSNDINNNNNSSNQGVKLKKQKSISSNTSSISSDNSPDLNQDFNPYLQTNSTKSVGTVTQRKTPTIQKNNNSSSNNNNNNREIRNPLLSPLSISQPIVRDEPPSVSSPSPSPSTQTSPTTTTTTTTTSTISSDNSPDLNAEVNPYLKPNSMNNITNPKNQ